MKQIKVSEARGPALDWLVAKCEGKGLCVSRPDLLALNIVVPLPYSSDWAYGGPIIAREVIELSGPNGRRRAKLYWSRQAMGSQHKEYHLQAAKTDLIAAMRCYVSSKLGDTVEVPEELL